MICDLFSDNIRIIVFLVDAHIKAEAGIIFSVRKIKHTAGKQVMFLAHFIMKSESLIL